MQCLFLIWSLNDDYTERLQIFKYKYNFIQVWKKNILYGTAEGTAYYSSIGINSNFNYHTHLCIELFV